VINAVKAQPIPSPRVRKNNFPGQSGATMTETFLTHLARPSLGLRPLRGGQSNQFEKCIDDRNSANDNERP
jgi:hypothetical protein